jgi:CBS domain-containing protein
MSNCPNRKTKNNRVIFGERDTPSEEVAFRMTTHDISGVPVVEKGKKVVGIISENDFMFCMGQNDITSFMGVVAQCLRNKGCTALKN